MSEYYNNNINLKKIDTPIDFSLDDIQEYILCKNDPIYFIKKYCKIISLDLGLIDFNLFDYQINFINAIHNERLICSMQPRQMGKCFAKDTTYKVRNKTTGEILYVTAKELHEKM